MNPLEPPDSHHLRAAIGWIELGNGLEATDELEQITVALRSHPDVLEVRWRIGAQAKQWERCIELATALTQITPEQSLGWIYLANSLYWAGRTPEARDTLLGVRERFPDEPGLPYNLACYECQLGNLAKAINWLDIAFGLGTGKRLRRAALEDEDLQPLWKHLGKV